MNDHLSFLQTVQQEKFCCAVCTEMAKCYFDNIYIKSRKKEPCGETACSHI